MERKYVFLGIMVMITGTVLTGALQDVLWGGESFFALKIFVGYAVMGLGIFAAKRSIQSGQILGVFGAIGLFLIGSIINGKLFELLGGDVALYAKYFGGVAVLALGGWISKHSLFGGSR